ncbi:6138_t:CDS:2, partial [Dentiscutata heterogama]
LSKTVTLQNKKRKDNIPKEPQVIITKEDCFSPKINADYIDMWIQKLPNKEKEKNNENISPVSSSVMSEADSLHIIQENYDELSLNSANNDNKSDYD